MRIMNKKCTSKKKTHTHTHNNNNNNHNNKQQANKNNFKLFFIKDIKTVVQKRRRRGTICTTAHYKIDLAFPR